MLRRIYWMLPDSESARAMMDDLLLARVPYRRMHFVGREDSDMRGLHAASVLQTSDVIRSAEMGLVLGGTLGGIVGAAVAVGYPVFGPGPEWGWIAVLAVVGVLFGVWASTMIGVSTPARRLQRFAAQIEQGKILLIVDVPMWNVEGIEARLQARHPEAHLEGVEPDVPAFP